MANRKPPTPSSAASSSAVAPPAAPSAEPPLSYTQINCLENVHRLLKSTQSRPDTPQRPDEPFDERKYPPALPLTKKLLQEHTKRFEDEYKDTWCRRLKRLSEDVPCSPPPAPKQFRPNVSQTPPLHWSLAQKQEFYRSLAPNPPPPPGKNYQITYTPLDDPLEKKSDVENVASAFTNVQTSPKVIQTAGAAATTAAHQRVIITPSSPAATTTNGGTNSPPCLNQNNACSSSGSSSLLMLRDNTNC